MFPDDYDRFDDERQLSSVLRRLADSFHADTDPPLLSVTSGAEVLASVGLRLRQLREKSGWTVEEVSERTGVPLAKLSEFEAGAPQVTSMMTRSELARLTSACCGTLDDILGSDHPWSKPSLPFVPWGRGGSIDPHG